MNVSKGFQSSLLAASILVLAGCGGKDGGTAAGNPNQQNPNVNGQYSQNQPMNQPYMCSNGWMQLRNSFGNSQCYSTTNIVEACAQAGGMIQGNLCRRERSLPGSLNRRIRNRNGYQPANIPLMFTLQGGESLRLDGCFTSYYDNEWSAQLLQNGMAVGSASSNSYNQAYGSDGNFTISSLSSNGAGNSTYYSNQNYQSNTPYANGQPVNNGQAYNNGQIVNNPAYNQAYNNQAYNTGLPNGQMYNNGYNNGAYNNGQVLNGQAYNGAYNTQVGVQAGAYYNQGQMNMGYQNQGTLQSFLLQIQFTGEARLTLRGTAISCEDGRGNSYPCQ